MKEEKCVKMKNRVPEIVPYKIYLGEYHSKEDREHGEEQIWDTVLKRRRSTGECRRNFT